MGASFSPPVSLFLPPRMSLGRGPCVPLPPLRQTAAKPPNPLQWASLGWAWACPGNGGLLITCGKDFQAQTPCALRSGRAGVVRGSPVGFFVDSPAGVGTDPGGGVSGVSCSVFVFAGLGLGPGTPPRGGLGPGWAEGPARTSTRRPGGAGEGKTSENGASQHKSGARPRDERTSTRRPGGAVRLR